VYSKGFLCGMKPYSEDLRERIAAACAAGNSSLGQVAARFSVSLSFVNKLLKRQRTSGTVAALPHRGGPAPLLDAAARARLAACVARQPDATRDELRVHLAASGGPAVGRTTVWQALQALDLRRKKRASTPLNATPNG
jgi:transposase